MSVPRHLPRVRWKPDRVRDALLLLVLVAAVAAGWFGWSWWSAAHDDDLVLARERDAVLQQAREALVTLNTVDYRTAKQDVGRWAKVTTGRFGKELVDRSEDQVRQVKESKTVTTATVANASVTELRPRRSSARVMVVLNIEVRSTDGEDRARHSLLEAELSKTEGGWKVTSVQAAR